MNASLLKRAYLRGIACLFLFSPILSATPNRPNIILINIDNHDKGSLSYFGNTFIETPNIDRLFEQGTRLQNFRTAGRCTSSRSALMTGQYHARNGALGTGGAWGQMKDGVRTMAHVFKDGGYNTAMFGKWHLGDSHGQRPEDRGFEEVVSFENGAYLRGAIVRQGYNSSRRTGEAHRFNHNGTYQVYEGFRTDVWFREANKFLDGRKACSKPFFIYLATVTAHAPNFGPKDLQAYYKKKYEREEFQWLRERFLESLKRKGIKNQKDTSHPYDHAAEMANLDQNVGRLVAKLKETDLWENTIIVYMSDGLGGSSASIKKPHPLSNNPTTILWPGQTQGRDLEKPLVANIDILPTFAEICGILLPDEYANTLDGQSFASLLAVNSATPWKPRPYIYDHQSGYGKDGIQGQMAIRPYSSASVTLPNGESISWRGGKLKGKGNPDDIKAAKEAYESWLKSVLKDFPLGAYMHTHTDGRPIFLRSYPITDGPGEDGLQQYLFLYFKESGTYTLDTNVSDYFGADYEEGKPTPATFTLFRKKTENRLPLGFDDKLKAYRVLPETLKAAFSKAATTQV